ncbi:GNAT family N-acetyltransferase [Demequina sp. SO4-13]|uniref:GNAT family N-acetyltransferase n=1 Tax=Demequina sp. SO4-13 TaxID=3401027 RepID=UPI003AF94923
MSDGGGSEPTGFTLQQVDEESPLLLEAIALADANREFLGILTPAAWREYAARGGVIVATKRTQGGNQSVLGVASFRRGRQRAALAHLAVASEARRLGIARSLVGEVARLTADLSGILVRCRRDFPANDVWPQLGFVPRGEQPGRGKIPKVITWWWFDHGHTDLFAWDGIAGTNVAVVLDANVFIDLHGEQQGSEEALTREALDEAQESGAILLVTPELPRELDRRANASERKRLIGLANATPMVRATRDSVETTREAIDAEAEREHARRQDSSDIAHLAYAAAAGVRYVVTRDDRAKRRLRNVAASLGVEFFSPVQLAAELAMNDGGARYWPAVAHGQGFQVVEELRVAIPLLEHLNADSLGEPRRAITRRLEPLLLAGTHGQAWALCDAAGIPLAGVAMTREGEAVDVHLARVSTGQLEDVLARYIVHLLSTAAALDGSRMVRVTDPLMPPAVQVSLAAQGFARTQDRYVAPRLRGLLSPATAREALKALPGAEQDAIALLRRLADATDGSIRSSELLALETALAPVTLIERSIPVWSVPIRPAYAYELLGIGESLLARKDSLGISLEHVYYTGAPAIPPAGSRVLWYLSGANTPAYVAQSVVIESGHLPWKDAYRVHRRLGVYTREEVRNASTSSGKVGYIVFGRTRPLHRSVSLNRASKAASDLGTRMMLRGPWKLPAVLANELMEVAFEHKR